MEELQIQLIRDAFFSGHYGRCLELVKTLPSSTDEPDRAEASSLALCARAGLGQDKSETPSPAHTGDAVVAAVNALDFLSEKNVAQKVMHLQKLKETAQSMEPMALYLAAAALFWEGTTYDPVEAFRLSCASDALEVQALRVMQLLLSDRPDLATKLSLELMSRNEDAAVTKLASAATHIASGNYQEAYLTYGDLQSHYAYAEQVTNNDCSSILLYNGKAVANMCREMWPEALEDLEKAYQLNPRNRDTLANLVVCSLWLGKTDNAYHFMNQLQDVDPTHPTLQGVIHIREVFAQRQKSTGTTKSVCL